MTFQLPEKDYFTRKEISEKWQCDLSLVDYYIENGRLREAFRSSVAAFSGLQTTRYYKCDKQSELFKTYCGDKNLKFKIIGLLKQLEIEEPDYFSDDLVGCPKFIYINQGESMIFHYPLDPYSEDYRLNSTPHFAYLSGMGNDRYIPFPFNPSALNDEEIFRLEYYEQMDEYLVIPKEERDRFESLHTDSQEKEKSIRERIEDLRADRTAEFGERKSDHCAHETAEDPLPSSLQTVREGNSSNSPHCQELARKATSESDGNTQVKMSSAGGKATAARFKKAREMALAMAENNWAEWKADRTNPTCPSLGETADLILGAIYADLKAVELTKESVPEKTTIKTWIKPLAPKEAVPIGRPKKR